MKQFPHNYGVSLLLYFLNLPLLLKKNTKIQPSVSFKWLIFVKLQLPELMTHFSETLPLVSPSPDFDMLVTLQLLQANAAFKEKARTQITSSVAAQVTCYVTLHLTCLSG